MAEHVALHLEHAVCCKEAQYTAECVRVGTDGSREVGSGAGCLLQRVCDTEVGNHVKASGQTIAARNLCQRSERIWLNHGTLLGIVIWTLWFCQLLALSAWARGASTPLASTLTTNRSYSRKGVSTWSRSSRAAILRDHFHRWYVRLPQSDATFITCSRSFETSCPIHPST